MGVFGFRRVLGGQAGEELCKSLLQCGSNVTDASSSLLSAHGRLAVNLEQLYGKDQSTSKAYLTLHLVKAHSTSFTAL